ncbi:MAG: phosphoenolpyruvate synthase [Leptolinea sp.]|jgi:pyruvate,water dikinase|nr:phosphoenolpyruvate synthase [Leptolinea sp.]
MPFIRSLADLDKEDLPLAGGKGANLGAMLRAGLPVPAGFVVTTQGYRKFTAANHLNPVIHEALAAIQPDDLATLNAASAAIRKSFQSGRMPAPLKDEIVSACKDFITPGRAVAVRSSATAEDLPDLSFAGQQDTYLNISGEAALLDAVIRCWASLWTARAIGYRTRNRIPQEDVMLAVVVQEMVQSDVSGVLFTANPLTGKRGETVIDATLGLGEALVSGQVEPDHYVVDDLRNAILSKTIGAKAISIIGQAEGGTITVKNKDSYQQALPDEHILELVRLGRQAQDYLGGPQDMEWAWADGQMYVVQSRPVTSLYPLPAVLDDDNLEILLSFGVWQGMLDPYTPFGQDAFSYLIVGFARKFGEKITADRQRVMLAAGERLFVNLTHLLRSSLGRNFVNIFLSAIDPETIKVIRELLKDPRFSPVEHASLMDRLNFLRIFIPLAFNVVANMLAPARARARLERNIDLVLDETRSRFEKVNDISDLVAIFEELTDTMPGIMMPKLVGGIAGGQAPYQILLRTLDFPGSQDLLFDLARGLPHNVTTRMDLELWETAKAIQTQTSAVDHFLTTDTEKLVAEYRQGALPAATQTAVADFLARYGMRGVGEIDLGRPRWRENPANLFQALKSYLQIDPTNAPDVVFRRGEARAAEAAKQILAEVRKQPGGFIRAHFIGGLIRRFRELGGLRETPKFFVVKLFSVYRYALLAQGEKLAAEGTFDCAEDILFLHVWELKALGKGEKRDWKSLIAERRRTYEREMHRRRVPRVLLTDGTSYYDAPSTLAADDLCVLTGSPVSAGVTEGVVRVVLDPHGVQMQPGDILVCPATDPAWTPLFLAAGGLVTEVGGMMTHGSVVAREYGIPAVVGVSRATQRLRTGQRVRLDGSNGVVQVLG